MQSYQGVNSVNTFFISKSGFEIAWDKGIQDLYNLILKWDSFINSGEKQLSINLIIGTGKRARETIIPALEILNDEIFLYSRN